MSSGPVVITATNTVRRARRARKDDGSMTAGRSRTGSVVANLDSGAQPYFRLERTAVEATQQFSTTRNVAAPQTIKGLGLDADWYPAQQQLQTTDGVRLITITVAWHGVSQGRRRALAVAVARPYLRPKRSG